MSRFELKLDRLNGVVGAWGQNFFLLSRQNFLNENIRVNKNIIRKDQDHRYKFFFVDGSWNKLIKLCKIKKSNTLSGRMGYKLTNLKKNWYCT